MIFLLFVVGDNTNNGECGAVLQAYQINFTNIIVVGQLRNKSRKTNNGVNVVA